MKMVAILSSHQSTSEPCYVCLSCAGWWDVIDYQDGYRSWEQGQRWLWGLRIYCKGFIMSCSQYSCKPVWFSWSSCRIWVVLMLASISSQDVSLVLLQINYFKSRCHTGCLVFSSKCRDQVDCSKKWASTSFYSQTIQKYMFKLLSEKKKRSVYGKPFRRCARCPCPCSPRRFGNLARFYFWSD